MRAANSLPEIARALNGYRQKQGKTNTGRPEMDKKLVPVTVTVLVGCELQNADGAPAHEQLRGQYGSELEAKNR